jgi:hypothetical protein
MCSAVTPFIILVLVVFWFTEPDKASGKRESQNGAFSTVGESQPRISSSSISRKLGMLEAGI